MKRNTLITSIALIVIGFITLQVGNSMSTVVPVPGEPELMMVQDSILMPIGVLIMFLGVLALIVVLIWYLVAFIRGRLKKDQA
jgi:uncharacterized membrane protein YidH (DUF202 family)